MVEIEDVTHAVAKTLFEAQVIDAEYDGNDEGEAVELIETVEDTDALDSVEGDANEEMVALWVEGAVEDTVPVEDALTLPEAVFEVVIDEFPDTVVSIDGVVHVVAVEHDETDVDDDTEGVFLPYDDEIVGETDTLAQPEVDGLKLAVADTLTVTLCEDEVIGDGVVDDEYDSVEVAVVQRVLLPDKVDEIEAVSVALVVDEVDSERSFVCVPDGDSEALRVAEAEAVVVSVIETVTDTVGDKVALTQLLNVGVSETVKQADALPVCETEIMGENDSTTDRE